MYTGFSYPIRHFLWWIRREILFLVVVSSIPTVIYAVTGWRWLGLPWFPIAMLGTAVAFVIGFKNNGSYARVWEARTSWGSIISASRAFGVLAADFFKMPESANNEKKPETAVARQLIFNHLAWLTAFRFQLREPRDWESMSKPTNAEYREKYYEVEELDLELLNRLQRYMSEEDFTYVATKRNRATQILHLQARKISELMRTQLIDYSPAMQMQKLLMEYTVNRVFANASKIFHIPGSLLR